jgi:hypothetical protein
MTRRNQPMAEKLKAIAAGPLVDPMHINVWTEDAGEPKPSPGRQVEIKYHRADGKPVRRRKTAKP